MTSAHQFLQTYRRTIASKVRALRRSRHWTQRELAAQLGLSQNRLSEIERGGGSFTAEQFLLILRIFNVDLGAFVDGSSTAREGELQNALIRAGATHLRQARDVVDTGRYKDAADIVRAVLLNPFSDRFVTALAPVFVKSCDSVSLPAVQSSVAEAGRPNRLGWLVEHTTEALQTLDGKAGAWGRDVRRAQLVLGEFLAHLTPSGEEAGVRDSLDRGIRSTKTLDSLWQNGSPISKRWQIVSALQVSDFVDALRQVRESY